MVIMSYNSAMKCLIFKDVQALLKEFFIDLAITVLANLRVMSY